MSVEKVARTLLPAELVRLGRAEWSEKAVHLLQGVRGTVGRLSGDYGTSGSKAQLERQAAESPNWLREQLAMARRQLDAASAAIYEGIGSRESQPVESLSNERNAQ